MATYEELDAEEKATVQHYVNVLLRPAMGDIARLLNRLTPVLAAYNGEVKGILALLNTGTEVPNKSGLAGISTLTSGEVATMSRCIETLLALNSADHLQLYVKAAGAENVRD